MCDIVMWADGEALLPDGSDFRFLKDRRNRRSWSHGFRQQNRDADVAHGTVHSSIISNKLARVARTFGGKLEGS